MWSLGMILHMLLFFKLPYQHYSGATEKDSSGDCDVLEKEVQTYRGQVIFQRETLTFSINQARFPS